MYFGVQYYPEQWPEERWETDAELMAQAGVTTVRMGEFAWSRYQPDSEILDFGWMDRAVSILEVHGIKTIMCTCSRTPPPWLFAREPGLTNVDVSGRRVRWGGRYTYCPSSERFAELAREIDRRVVEHFSGNPAVVGWQIDNEVGSNNDCYCDTCRAAFHRHLSAEYGSPEDLNERWGADFWSFRIASFEDVPLPRKSRSNPQLDLAYRRFLSSLNSAFVADRAEMIRSIDPGKWITTNFQSFGARHTDYFSMEKHLDYNGMNYYPLRSPEFLLDYYRSGRGRMLVLEQFTRLEGEDSGPGIMRLYAYRALAHGAAGINFFRWRVGRHGQEMHADGIVPQSGKPARRYRELSKMGAELRLLGDLFDSVEPRSDVAILVSYDSRWAEQSMTIDGVDTAVDAVRLHDGLSAANISVDAGDPRRDLSRYRVVFAPRLFLVDDAIAENLRGYVEAGGALVLTAGSGIVDRYGRCFDTPRPGPLAEIAGIEVSDLAKLHGEVTVGGTDGQLLNFRGRGLHLCDEIHPGTARAIAEYTTGWRAGLPAVTVNRFGDGTVYYLGTSLDAPSAAVFARTVCATHAVESVLHTPDGVRVHRLAGPEREVLVVLNYDTTPRRVIVGPRWNGVQAQPIDEAIVVDGLDVVVLSRHR